MSNVGEPVWVGFVVIHVNNNEGGVIMAIYALTGDERLDFFRCLEEIFKGLYAASAQ